MPGMKHENRFFSNMGVPISGAKVVHRASSNPQPIVVEKLTGKYVTPRQSLQGSMVQVVQQERLGAYGGSSRNPFCSRDTTMDQALILAQLDMKKNKRNPEADLPFGLEESEDADKVSKPVKTRQQRSQRVHEVSNRPQRNASVQISRLPNRRKSPEPTPLSELPVTTNSPPTHDKESSSQEIQRLQADISKQLTQLNDLLNNLVKECNNPKSALSEEEQEETDTTHEQGALRALTRQVYIVQQQVADVERKLNAMHNYKTAARVHANKLCWTKSRLTSAYRGALKSLQGMTNHLRRFSGPVEDPIFQLRLVDLLNQLLQSVRTLLDLYLQLTSIFSKNLNATCPELLELVDITDSLQAEWQTQLEHKLKRLMSNGVQGGARSPHLSKKNPTNKPVPKNFRRQLSLEVTPERKSILRKPLEPSNLNRAVHRKMTKKLPTTKRTAKSVIFPAHIQIHRKHSEAFSHQITYAQPTLSSRMKSLPPELQPEEISEPPEQRQFSPTIEEEEEPEELAGFGRQHRASSHQPAHKMETIGASIIEELLALESQHPKKQEEARSSSATVTQETEEGHQRKSLADVHFTDEALKSIDLNLPPLEVLLHRLGEMENEQIQIRSRWASMRYHDTEAAAEECHQPKKGSVSTANHQPRTPSPIYFSKKAGSSKTVEIFQEQPQMLSSGEFPGAIRFTKKSSRKDCQPIQIEEREQETVDQSVNKRRMQSDSQKQVQRTTTLDSRDAKPKRLFLSNKILKNITENRERFSNYLLNSAYHQVESFDPWRLTEELADSILEDCIQGVSEEMQDVSQDLVHHLFNNEFVQLPPPPPLSSTQPPPIRRQQDTSGIPPT